MTSEFRKKNFASRYGGKFKSEESTATEIGVSIYVSTGNDERNLTMCTGLKLIQTDKSYIREKKSNFQIFRFSDISGYTLSSFPELKVA